MLPNNPDPAVPSRSDEALKALAEEVLLMPALGPSALRLAQGVRDLLTARDDANAKVEQLIGDLHAVSQDYTDALARVRQLEQERDLLQIACRKWMGWQQHAEALLADLRLLPRYRCVTFREISSRAEEAPRTLTEMQPDQSGDWVKWADLLARLDGAGK